MPTRPLAYLCRCFGNRLKEAERNDQHVQSSGYTKDAQGGGIRSGNIEGDGRFGADRAQVPQAAGPLPEDARDGEGAIGRVRQVPGRCLTQARPATAHLG